MPQKTIVIASDHAGVDLKTLMEEVLASWGYNVIDAGTSGKESVDYSDYANALCNIIASGKAAFGVLMCGSGIGMSIAANRHKGIRAALCHEGLSAQLARKHNDANVLVLGARLIGADLAKDCLHHFLYTEFEGGRHQRRIDKLG